MFVQGLLALVRKLIDYGRELAVTVRQRVATDPSFAHCAFGTRDLAVIFATIARGLNLAMALEARLVEQANRPDAKPKPTRASSPRQPRPARPSAAPITTETNPALARLPTPEQIAADIRRRPIGAVIADICRDLGLLPSHELWSEVRQAVVRYGGNLARLVKTILDRPPCFAAQAAAPPLPPTPLIPIPAGTGPP